MSVLSRMARPSLPKPQSNAGSRRMTMHSLHDEDDE
jgi:hypothetical protein